MQDKTTDAELKPCLLPPEGWYCTRGAGHDGPCAAVEEDHNPDGFIHATAEQARIITEAVERRFASLTDPRPVTSEVSEAIIADVLTDHYDGPRSFDEEVAAKIVKALAASPSVGSVAKPDEGAVERVTKAVRDEMVLQNVVPYIDRMDLASVAKAAIAAFASINAVGSVEPNDKDERIARLTKALRKIADAPAWGYPERWETTPSEVRQLARAALANSDEDVG